MWRWPFSYCRPASACPFSLVLLLVFFCFTKATGVESCERPLSESSCDSSRRIMSSPPKEGAEAAEKKAGHAPAVKVAGGMRIVQHHRETKPKEKEEPEEPNPNDEHKVVISGVVAKGDKDFPAQAVKSFHEKPAPSIQPKNAPTHHNIQQPRK